MLILMGLLGAVVGGILGAGNETMFFAVAGALIGVMLGWLVRLQGEVRALRERPARAPAAEDRVPAVAAAAPVAPTPPAPPRTSAAPVARDDWRPRPAAPAAAPPSAAPSSPPPWEPALRWLLSGNLPVKVGVLVTFFGVAFLLKYAVDNQLLRVPIELRLALVAAAGVALVVFGWRLRSRMRTYALSIQGGGVGILYLVVYAAFRLFALMPQGLAFAVLFALMVFASWLAYSQRAQALAVLGSVGGFLAPLLVSTGEGSHIALFGYYLVLNLAIFGLAWVTAWRKLNLIGFAFTFIIGSWWAYGYYRPEYFASTQPFLAAFFVIYTGIAALFSLRQPPQLKGTVDGTLVFGTPVLALPLQAGLMRASEYGLAYSTLIAAGFYAALAYALYRSGRHTVTMIVEAFVALAIASATLAIPLAFDAQWTAGAWALEGAALVWVGTRQRRSLMRIAGVALIFAAGIAELLSGQGAGGEVAILNGAFIAGILVALAGFFAVAQLGRAPVPSDEFASLLRLALFAWAVFWWLLAGVAEVNRFVPDRYQLEVELLFVSFGVWCGALAAQRLGQLLFASPLRVWLPLTILVLVGTVVAERQAHPLAYFGWAAWPLALFAHYDGIRRAGLFSAQERERWWSAGLWLVAALLALEARWLADGVLGAADGWRTAAGLVAIAAVLYAALAAARRRAADAWTWYGALPLLAGAAVYLLLENLAHGGGTGVLPYLPILNPMDAAAAIVLLAGVHWAQRASTTASWNAERRRHWELSVAGLGWALLTFAVVRAVHQLAGMDYTVEAALSSMTLQASLSLVWGATALVCMVGGARRGLRDLWIGGAALMALVVGKLFLLDLGSTGTVERIVSFIGVGALLLVVGYLAPAPARMTPDDQPA